MNQLLCFICFICSILMHIIDAPCTEWTACVEKQTYKIDLPASNCVYLLSFDLAMSQKPP